MNDTDRRKHAIAVQLGLDAPYLMERAYAAACAVGKRFAELSEADKQQTDDIANRLMNAISTDDAALDKISGSPEYIIALASMFAQALVSYGRTK